MKKASSFRAINDSFVIQEAKVQQCTNRQDPYLKGIPQAYMVAMTASILLLRDQLNFFIYRPNFKIQMEYSPIRVIENIKLLTKTELKL